jgi:alpha-N-acetylglucosamine transferase
MSAKKYLCYKCFSDLCKVRVVINDTCCPWTCSLCEVHYPNMEHLRYVCYCDKDVVVVNEQDALDQDYQNLVNVYICKNCTDSKKFIKFEKKEHEHEWCLHPECIESDKEFMNKYQLECHYRNEH